MKLGADVVKQLELPPGTPAPICVPAAPHPIQLLGNGKNDRRWLISLGPSAHMGVPHEALAPGFTWPSSGCYSHLFLYLSLCNSYFQVNFRNSFKINNKALGRGKRWNQGHHGSDHAEHQKHLHGFWFSIGMKWEPARFLNRGRTWSDLYRYRIVLQDSVGQDLGKGNRLCNLGK